MSTTTLATPTHNDEIITTLLTSIQTQLLTTNQPPPTIEQLSLLQWARDEKHKQQQKKQQNQLKKQRLQQLQADIATNQHGDDDKNQYRHIEFDLLPLNKSLVNGGWGNRTVEKMINSSFPLFFKADHTTTVQRFDLINIQHTHDALYAVDQS